MIASPANATACTFRATALAALGMTLIGTADAAPKDFSEDDVSAAVMKVIAERSKNGLFSLRDGKTGTTLTLEFDSIRVVRGLNKYGWFPDVIFHVKGEPQKKYAVDFWLRPDGDELRLIDARVHKDPQPDGSSWMMITRAPLLWWWLPTLERKSAVAGIEAWQVMGAVHEYIAAQQRDGAFPLIEADGKTIPLELIQIDQPVGRSKADGGYFACAEFRNLSDPATSRDIDFKLDVQAGSLHVASARQHENSSAGSSTQPPAHCRFEGQPFDIVD